MKRSSFRPPESLSSTSGPITDETRFEPRAPIPLGDLNYLNFQLLLPKWGNRRQGCWRRDFWPFSYVHHFTCLHLHHCQYFTFSDGYASGREEETGKRRNAATENGGGTGGGDEVWAGFFFFKVRTLPHSSPLKIGHPKRKVLFQPPIFRFYVSFREGIFFYSFTTSLVPNRGLHHWHHIPCWPPGFRRVLGWSRCVGLVVGQIALVCGITLKHNRYLASVGVLVDVWTVFFDKKRGC